MNTGLVVILTLVAGIIGSTATLIAARSTSATARAKLVQEITASGRADQTAASVAHTDAQTALAAVSEKLAQASYAYADRLRADLDRAQQRHADELQAATVQISKLQQRVTDIQIELRLVRAQLQTALGGTNDNK